MLPLVYETNFYAMAFWVIYCVWLVLEIVGALKLRVKEGAKKQDRGSRTALIGGLYIGLLFNFTAPHWFPGATITRGQSVLVVIGLLLMILGIVIRQYAIRVLGKYFTYDVATRADQQVVQQGPYRFIRHPSYSGYLLTCLGIGLAMTNWVSLVGLMVFSFIGALYRVRVEEQVLCSSLGQPYEEYMQHTKRFIPFVY